MSEQSRPPVWQMIREAMEALGSDTTNVAVRNWIIRQYPGTKRNTISCHIIMCTVNHSSRIHYPQNQKPRTANGRYDFLFRPERGQLQVYDQARHGQWTIIQREDGSFTVAEVGHEQEVEQETGLTEEEEAPRGYAFTAEDQLRDYLAARPDTMEEGLQLYVDEYGNTGVEYNTPVGRIDLLAEDADGGLVVVELKVSRSPDAVVGQLLRYMGWVKRHLAEGKRVRGFIVARNISDRVRYAVADIPHVSLKAYELSVAVRDLPSIDASPTNGP